MQILDFRTNKKFSYGDYYASNTVNLFNIFIPEVFRVFGFFKNCVGAKTK